MPRICATIPEKLEDELKNISRRTNKTFSKVVLETIELGLLSYKNNQKTIPEDQKNLENFDSTEREYLLRILNIDSEILRKLYNEPSKRSSKTAESILEEIKIQVKKRMGEIKQSI